MTVIDAPTLAGSRDKAQELLSTLPMDLSNSDVTLDCGDLIAATASFADELVREILVVRHARSLRAVRLGDEDFSTYLVQRAAAREVGDRLFLIASPWTQRLG